MYQGILLINPIHFLTECRRGRQSSVPASVPSRQWCQSLFTPAGQFSISTQTGRRTTSFRGLFWWRLTRKSCGKGPMQFWFLSSPISISWRKILRCQEIHPCEPRGRRGYPLFLRRSCHPCCQRWSHRSSDILSNQLFWCCISKLWPYFTIGLYVECTFGRHGGASPSRDFYRRW